MKQARALVFIALFGLSVWFRVETQSGMIALDTKALNLKAFLSSFQEMFALGARQLLSVGGTELLLGSALLVLLRRRRKDTNLPTGPETGIRPRPSEPRLPPLWVAPVLAGFLSLVLRSLVLKNAIWVSDEWSYDFQARILALGHVTWKAPPFPQHFVTANLVMVNDRWGSVYSLGWPILLALGGLVGLENAVTPLLSGLSVYALELLTLKWTSNPASACWCGYLCLLCPFLVCNGATLFPHTAMLLTATCVLLCIERGSVRPLLAGIASGFSFSLREPEAIVLLVGMFPLMGYGMGRKISNWSWFLLGFSSTASLAFLGNWCLTGNPFLSGYSVHGDAGVLSEPVILKLKFISIIGTRCMAWMPPLSVVCAFLAISGVLGSLPGASSKESRSVKLTAGFGLRASYRVWAVLGITLLYLPIFCRPGSAELGSRYLFVPALLWLPLFAWELESRSRDHRVTVGLAIGAFSLLASYPPILAEALRHYQDKIRVEKWLQYLGSDALVFFRSDPDQIDLGNMRNNPNLQGQIRVWFLDPASNQHLRLLFPRRPAYIVDWDSTARAYSAMPYESDHDFGFDCLCGGFNLASTVHDLPGALATWKLTPSGSRWKSVADQNARRLERSLTP